MHVGGLLVFKGNGRSPQEQLETLRMAPVRSRPFDRQLAKRFGRPRWSKVPGVDTAAHVDDLALSGDADDRELMDAVSALHSVPVAQDRPMWQCRLIHGLSDHRFALYFKVHHACIDGVTGVRRIQGALSDAAEDQTTPVWAIERAKRPRRPKPAAADRLRATRQGLAALPGVARTVGNIVRDMLKGGDAAPYTAPNTPLNQLISGKRRVAWTALPLETIRSIGRACGATVNEVALAVCSTVLRELLLAMNALPPRPLVAMVPFSLRKPGQPASGGNDVSCMLVNLATHLDDPLQRLRTIIESSASQKRMLRAMSHQSANAYWLAMGFPAILASMAGVAQHVKLPFNVVVSNVPGPTQSLYHNGAELQAIYPLSLLFERQALNVTLVSYRDRIDIGLLSCGDAIPNLTAVSERITAALRDLEHLVAPRAAVAASTPAPR